MDSEKTTVSAASLNFDPDAVRAKYRAERDKRLRPDTTGQYIPADSQAEFSRYVDDPYVEPGFGRDSVDGEVEVTVIGGGLGGLILGARLKEAGFNDLRIIESGGDFGGTWYWNRYPGCRCDIESYIYMPFLEELGYMPTEKYAPASEIFEHCQRIGSHYGLYEGALFQTRVTGLRWDEDRQRWQVCTDRGDTLWSRFVAMSTGPLSRPKLPAIPGVGLFKGWTFHTSRWDYKYTGGDASGDLVGLADKSVGIIGTGATAIQCVPHLGRWAKQLHVFQRTPSSVDARNNRPSDPDWFKSLHPGWQEERMDNFTLLLAGGEAEVDLVNDGWTDVMRNLSRIVEKNPEKSAISSAEWSRLMEFADFQKMEQLRARVDSIVKDREKAEALKPWYRYLCKRPCFADGYLETFNRPNVTLVDTDGRGVDRLTERGAVVGAAHYELDCMIFATGFDVSSGYTNRIGYEVVGRDGVQLSDRWAEGARTLHGMQTAGFPNCFFISHVQTGVTLNYTHTLSEEARHIAFVLGEAKRRRATTVEATELAEREWCDEIARSSRIGTKFYAECTPGYYNSEGKPDNPNGFFSNTYGFGAPAFFKILREWRSNGRLDGVSIN